jgi:hypothetical protein
MTVDRIDESGRWFVYLMAHIWLIPANVGHMPNSPLKDSAFPFSSTNLSELTG